MLHLIPQPKDIQIRPGFLKADRFTFDPSGWDRRVAKLAAKLPQGPQGACLRIEVSGQEGESYTLTVSESAVTIQAPGPAGAFYGLQTLRQLLRQGRIPCLVIADAPDFSHRGFYHDATRGKIPTTETLKELIDQMAFLKLNSFQLYVEHTFAFRECQELHPATGCLTGEQMEELDAYCRENFIDFIPSVSTFGHLYELLNLPQYRHLRVAKEVEQPWNFWRARMLHHTIDPLHPESFPLVCSLLDQYAPHFTSDSFNICCDETFDLKNYPDDSLDKGRLYVDFVQKIVSHVQKKGKRVMMWADILLQHPETISELPQDVVFLNWNYAANPPQAQVEKLASLGRQQIVCPGTSTWSHLCEDVDTEEQNISHMAHYAKKYGALGILNTNWGDWANPCSLELAQYGLALGAAKSWQESTQTGPSLDEAVDKLIYRRDGGMERLRAVSRLHRHIGWNNFMRCYFARRYEGKTDVSPFTRQELETVQREYRALAPQLAGDDRYSREMALAAQGLCLMAQLYGKIAGWDVEETVDLESWLASYRRSWLERNQESELGRIEEVFRFCAGL